jgi:hypothetical protein
LLPPAPPPPALPPALDPRPGGTPSTSPAGAPTTGAEAPRAETAVRSAQARSVRASRTRFSTHGPAARRGTVISFRLARSGKVQLVVRSAANACEVVSRRQLAGVRGLNRVRFAGRVHGRPLAPGRYLIDVVVVRGTSRKRVGRVAVEVVRPGRRLTRAQRVAPLEFACPGSAASPSLPAAVVDPRAIARGGGGGPVDAAKAVGKSRGGVLGAIFRPPSIPHLGGSDEGSSGGLAWLGLGLYVVLIGAFLAMLLYVTRFLRGSWNP